MKISDMDDEQRRSVLDHAYQSAVDAHESGAFSEGSRHPSYLIAAWQKLGRARAEASGSPVDDEGGLGPVEIMKRNAQDNPPRTLGTPTPPVADPGVPARDSGGRWVFAGDKALPVPSAADSSNRRAIDAAIPGLDRLK